MCVLPGASGYSETWDTDDPATASKLRGYAWPTGDGRLGTAMMSYRFEPAASSKTLPAGFSDSQADIARRTLRFDQPIQAGVNDLLAASGATGGRPYLGRALRRRALTNVDFDGDGKRDIAAWFPPTTTTGTGMFRVFTSRSNFTTQVSQSLGQLGDTPVVADYNGDGITDYAVLHDAGGGQPAALAWRWCTSTPGAPGAAATHDCSAPPSYPWGNRGDVPIPGTRLSPTSPAELTVYRPSDGVMYTSVPYTSSTGRPLGLPATAWGQTPYVANFDTHAGNDFAFYNPQTGLLSLWLSASNWTTRIDRPFCSGTACTYLPTGTGTPADRAGAVPIWGLTRMKLPHAGAFLALGTEAFGLWDPNAATWNVMWDPVGSSAIETHQWGNVGDILVSGSVGRGASEGSVFSGARSDLVAYRSNNTSGPAYLYRCPFPAGSYGCPVGADQSIVVPGGQRRSQAFAVTDMIGDGKPELCTFDPQMQRVWCATSDSGYATTVTMSFFSSTAPLYQLVGGQLL